MSYTMAQLPANERPRERLVAIGHEALSVAELLAIVIGSGTRGKSVVELARDLLSQYGGLEGLAQANIAELSQMRGMGLAKAASLKAALALSLRLKSPTRPIALVRSPKQAWSLLRPLFAGQTTELVVALLRDVRCRPLRVEKLGSGGCAAVSLDGSSLFRLAIRYQAAGLVLAHNHPSLDLLASQQDVEATRRLITAGRLLEISVDDHLIVAENEYLSLRQAHPDLWN
jgi:DNA repair protein RadC